MDLKNIKIGIIGAGISGVWASNLARKYNATVSIFDDKEESQLVYLKELVFDDIELYTGGKYKEKLKDCDFVIVSPGVPLDSDFFCYIDKSQKVISEIEFAFSFLNNGEIIIIGITGSNGKSTTTTLCGNVIKASGQPCFVGGNLGEPFSKGVFFYEKLRWNIAVLELSSFQLEKIERFKPNISVILNISEDHLDRYPSMDEYINAKLRITENQTEEDYFLYDGEDKVILSLLPKVKAQKVSFASKNSIVELRGDKVIYNIGNKFYTFSQKELQNIVGSHNLRNLSAVITIAHLLGFSIETILQGIKEFVPLPHRMEFVGTVSGISFYNDSKATNVGATLASLKGVPGNKVVLLLGGKDKGGCYSPLIPIIKKRCRGVVLFGQAKDIIKVALEREIKEIPIVVVEELKGGVYEAMKLAKEGDSLLLAPACSSFDQYRDYKERGEHFKKIVKELMERI